MRFTGSLALLTLATTLGLPVAGSSAATPGPSPVCQSDAVGVASTAALKATHVLGPLPIFGLASSGTKVAVTSGTTEHVVDTGAGSVTSFPVESAEAYRPSFALDEAGNSYVIRYPYDVVKLDPAGVTVWSAQVSTPLLGLSLLGQGQDEHLVVTRRDAPTAFTVSLQGAIGGDVQLTGDSFAPTAAGGTVAVNDGRYVRTYDQTGTQTSTVGDAHRDNDPDNAGSPMHFYQLGGAVRLADGRMLVSDTKRGIMLFTSDGLLTGAVLPTLIDPLGLTQRAGMAIVGDQLYVVTGSRYSNNQFLSKVPVAAVLSAISPIPVADRRLGLGAGFAIPATDAYFPPGQTPQAQLYLDKWWSSTSGLSVCWTLRSSSDLRDDLPGVSGSANVADIAAQTTGIDLPVSQLGPDAYQLDAVLMRGDAVQSSTRAWFTVGAAGQRLNFSTLPAGADWGGPHPARGVALAAALGTGLQRTQLDWRNLLADGTDKPLNFSKYDADFAAAALAVDASGGRATFSVQIGEGGPERALVDNGTWAARVSEIVNHFKGSVHVWDVWNEPNNTYGNGANYVNNVLAPAFKAIKAADPSATVIGGSSLNVDLGFWAAVRAAGGLDDMDVAGVHPYTGHNRSLEDEGIIGQLQQLKAVVTKPDGTTLPIWDTESSWWSDGPSNFLGQADNSARMALWMRALGIQKWNYFLSEGGWGNSGVSFSAIQVGSFVKPAALALMTADQQLAGRPFLGLVDLGMSSTYAMRFGPKAGDSSSGELLVAWTDGLSVPVQVTADADGRSVDVTAELGGSQTGFAGTAARSLVLDSDPVYLALSGAGHLNLAPLEQDGSDLLLASTGATASATSSISANPASKAIDSVDGAAGGGDVPGTPAWVSAPGDASPSLQVHLAAPATLDRLVVGTHSLGSIVPALRDYEVEVRTAADQPWTTVASVKGQFYHRHNALQFPAQLVSDVRVRVLAVNYSGYMDNGVRPSWWPTDAASVSNASSPWYGPAVITELAGFAPSNRVSGLLPLNQPAPAPPPAAPSTNVPAAAPAAAGPTTTPPAAADVLTLSVTKLVKAGSSTKAVASLRDQGGRPLVNQPVMVLWKAHGGKSWTSSASGRTSAGGTFTMKMVLSDSVDVVVQYAGSAANLPSRSKVATIAVQRSVSAKANATKVAQGRTFTVSGSTGASPSVRLVLQQRRSNGGWKNVKAVTSSHGRFSLNISAGSRGKLQFRILDPGDSQHRQSASNVVTVSIS